MKMLVVSNMFPNKRFPSYGIFVKNFCDQLDALQISYDLSVMKKSEWKAGKFLRYAGFYLKTISRIMFSRYDLVYVHYASHSTPPVLWANKLKKQRIFVNAHGSDVVPENAKQEKMQKYTWQILQVSERIIVPSAYFQHYVSEKYQLPLEKIWIYPSAGVNPAVFYPMRQEEIDNIRNRMNLPKDQPIFGMISRASAGKGWDTFLKACKKYVEQHSDAHFMFVGDGVEFGKFKEMQLALHLDGEITVIDHLVSQDILAQLYNAIDYLVFPTQREGESLGLVALEAMACGTPVIASAYAAPKDYVRDGENGFQFQMGDSNELCSRIRRAVECFVKPEYAKMCQNAQKTASSFLVSAITQNLREILENSSWSNHT